MTKYKGFKTLEVLEGADNYNRWIASRLAPHIKSPALEIGAGIGNISEFFSDRKELVLTDIDSNLTNFLREKFKKNKNIEIEELDIARSFGKINNKFRTIYAVNVLEHIKNDEIALKNANNLLLPGGKLILLVPAKKFAYTKLDKSLGHFRRYEKGELRVKLENSGFEIEKLEYFNALGLISWIIRSKITRNHKELKKSHVKFFDSLVPLLRLLESKRGLPFGISLIAVAVKK